MTVQDLVDALAAACGDVYELALPKGLQRGIVWHRYGRQTVKGDDTTVLAVPRLQLDLLWSSGADTLLTDVESILDTHLLPYSEQDVYYDESYERMRAILQVTVV